MIYVIEFIMAAMNKDKLMSFKKIEQAFKIFDADGDGFISNNEFRTIMGGMNESIWNQFLSEVDQNQDGKISLAEFKHLLRIY
jgi:Ca2+-binding EF-hand superfamily protein